MSEEARENRERAARIARESDSRENEQARANREWRAAVSACVPEFLSAVRELKVKPDRVRLRKMWLVSIPIESEPIEPGYGVARQTIAVYGDGTWDFVETYWVSNDLRPSVPPKLVVKPAPSQRTISRDHPVSAEMIRANFVSRLSATK